MDSNLHFWKDRNVLITGITGFAGSWLAEILTSKKYCANVYGLIRKRSRNIENIEHLIRTRRISEKQLITGNIHDIVSILEALKRSKAEIIFHLAAQTDPDQSFLSPIDTYNTNVIGTANLLEACRIFDRVEIIHYSGSSEEYGLVINDNFQYKKLLKKYKRLVPEPKIDKKGNVISEIPVKETNPLRPVSPYGLSKVVSSMMCDLYFQSYGMHIRKTRAFNHEGPRRSLNPVTSVITKQIAEGIKYGRDTIELGDISTIRDFSDVRDIIRGYILVVEKGENGDIYNLCSGQGLKIEDVLKTALKIGREEFGLSKKMNIKTNKHSRISNAPILIGDYSKIKKKLGWKPSIPFEKTLKDMISWFLQKI